LSIEGNAWKNSTGIWKEVDSDKDIENIDDGGLRAGIKQVSAVQYLSVGLQC
jgi:hypothetical protein